MKPFLISLVLAAAAVGGEFKVAKPGYEYEFPRDHGSHPEYRVEWWYLTGHLFAEGGRRFGVQVTFFRTALDPETQSYLAHVALLDVESGEFLHQERLHREGWEAGAEVSDLNVWNGNWRLKRNGENLDLTGSVLADALFELELKPAKPPVIFGENGVSKKADDPGAASYYITFPRLEASGTLNFRGQTFDVSGQLWMDHEISSSQLGEGQVGWDWASIQLDDGREIMVYILRREDLGGAPDPNSRLTWISRDGKTLTAFGPEEFEWDPQTEWTSPESGATYPIDPIVTCRTPDGGTMRLRLKPVQPDQELNAKIIGVGYWEGACDVYDADRPEAGRIGRAYVELTGYDGRLAPYLR